MSRTERAREIGLLILSPVLLLFIWEALSRTNVIDARFFSRPSEIAVTGWLLMREGTLPHDIGVSLTRIFAGFLFGAVPGAILGTMMGFSRIVNAILAPLVAVIFPIPKIAILPLLMIIFGLGEGSKVALIALGSVFLTLYSTHGGVKNLPAIYAEVSRSFGATKLQHIAFVVLRGALPSIFVGLKLSLQTSLLLIVAAEFVGAKTGIGKLIWSSWEVFAVDQMFVGLLTLSALGYILSIGLDVIERIVLPWREPRRRAIPVASVQSPEVPASGKAAASVGGTAALIVLLVSGLLWFDGRPAEARLHSPPFSPSAFANVGIAGQRDEIILHQGGQRIACQSPKSNEKVS